MDIRSKSHRRRVQYIPLLRLFFHANAVTSRRRGRVKRHLRPSETGRRRHPGRKRPNPRLERQPPRLRAHRLRLESLPTRRRLLPRRLRQKHQICRRRRHPILQKSRSPRRQSQRGPDDALLRPILPENPTDLVRFAICKKRETIAEAARRIRENPL